MSAVKVSVVIVPRERFSNSIACLDNLLARTGGPFELIYLDCNSPQHVRSQLEARASEGKISLIQTEQFLTPNQARNLGLKQAQGEYIAFVDNDLEVQDGWLEHLLSCARDTGAWVVSPLYLEGNQSQKIIHTAGGIARFRLINGKRRFFEEHLYNGVLLDELSEELQRCPTEMVEFHCVLVSSY